MRQVIITVNGPGEISAWLTPLSRALKARAPDLHIAVCLQPCVFSSGAERSVVDAIEDVDAVCSIAEGLDLIARRRFPPGFQTEADTLVVHLGGELALSALLARRLGARSMAYVEYPAGILKRFDRVLYNGLGKMPKKIGRIRPDYVGEMMVDAALAKAGHRADGAPLIGVFPGSRTYMIEFLLPYFAAAIDQIAAKRPDIEWAMARSDYTSDDVLRALKPPPADRDWIASPVTFREDGDARWFETEGGVRIDVFPGAEVFQRARVALTLPGTNTGEMAALGIPMVTVIPTYEACADQVPLPGLAGHVARIPLVGPWIKRKAARLALRGMNMVAMPNRRKGEMIVPEIVGQDLHGAIETALLGLFDDPNQGAAQAVREAMGPPGAAEKLAEAALAQFAPAPRAAPVRAAI
ncbi:MAG: hypothetical protein AAF871_01370 [Pseudomonadota bacterium]